MEVWAIVAAAVIGLAAFVGGIDTIAKGFGSLLKTFRADEEIENVKHNAEIHARLDSHELRIKSLENAHSELEDKMSRAIDSLKSDINARLDDIMGLIKTLINKS